MNRKLMTGCLVLLGLLVFLGAIAAIWGVRTYNGLVKMEENVKQHWAQVENVYQRRMDLIPNLVATVKGYAEHEQETLVAVAQARSVAKGIPSADPSLLDNPEAFARFQQAQQGLAGALQRLMVVVERYPDLKANESFLSLQSQLEGTENRISVERRRFNEVAMAYNVQVRVFPRALIARFFGFREKAYFQSAPEAAQAPVVDFKK